MYRRFTSVTMFRCRMVRSRLFSVFGNFINERNCCLRCFRAITQYNVLGRRFTSHTGSMPSVQTLRMLYENRLLAYKSECMCVHVCARIPALCVDVHFVIVIYIITDNRTDVSSIIYDVVRRNNNTFLP